MAVHQIGEGGLVMYWVTFGLMAFSALAFAVMTFTRPLNKRSHGYITLAIVTIAAIAYYAMAASGGKALVSNPDGNLRDIYYARYIDWFFTTPLLLLDIILLTGIPIGVTLWIVLADVAMIMLGLFGALSTNSYRWGYYGVSCAFFFVVLWGLFFPGAKGARARGGQVPGLYFGLAGYLALLWFGYPIVWGLAEGSDYISVTAEAASYAGLDIAAKVVFGWAVMLSHPLIARNQTDGSLLINSTNDPFVASTTHIPERQGGIFGGLMGKKRGAGTPLATNEGVPRKAAPTAATTTAGNPATAAEV
ncbi:family A G protein-coupled receptor-like protein [Coccomyxa subellipsoidea C-169]|uniref:Family A G protein-coupled receptor-like protein n=3 Tax=Trebouxiophyceae TaxID=75966 RepID=I0YUS5_COCSC|eukprot:XP_005646688.1 family A G protein-coupled receptor-like protein [Coccomyxa subellipsoidea C-169]